jgi:phosphonate transport system substrate-binding protein
MFTKTSKNFLSLVMLIGIVFVSACQPKATPPPATEPPTSVPNANLTQDQILTIGIVSTDPAGTIKSFQPMMDYMAKQLSKQGIVKGSVVVTPDLDTMAAKLKSGEVDLFYESPYGALYVYEKAGAIPMLVGWRKGVGVYHALIMVRKDSGITTLQGLQGKLIAFADPGSTTGYFLPKALMITSRLKLSEKSTGDTVAADEVGYMFAGSADNMITALLQGKEVAGAEESSVYDGLKQEDKYKLVVLAQTQDVPRSLILASSTMSQALRDQIIAVLKAAGNTDEGKAALKGAKSTAKFDDFPMGVDATMKSLKDLFAPVQ